jgi:hypothetical protein
LAKEVQAQIAEQLQQLEQAPSGAELEGASEAAQEPDQAPDGAAEEESATPAAPAPAFSVGQLARVKAGSKGPAGKKLKTIGKVGRVIGVGEDGRVHLRHGERSHELLVLEPDQLDRYTADPLIGSKVRILAAPGLDVRRAAFIWRLGVVEALRTDGWAVRLDGKDDADGQLEIFTTEDLEVLP